MKWRVRSAARWFSPLHPLTNNRSDAKSGRSKCSGVCHFPRNSIKQIYAQKPSAFSRAAEAQRARAVVHTVHFLTRSFQRYQPARSPFRTLHFVSVRSSFRLHYILQRAFGTSTRLAERAWTLHRVNYQKCTGPCTSLFSSLLSSLTSHSLLTTLLFLVLFLHSLQARVRLCLC